MFFKDICYLVFEEDALDSRRMTIKKRTEKKCYCNIKSVGFSEFYQANIAGYKPEVKLEIRKQDISNVAHIRIKNGLYKIIRVYEFQDKVELTLDSLVQ